MEIGRRLKELRNTLKITQVEFASRIRVSKGFFSNLEKGIRQPSDQLLKLICYEFSSSENWLLNGEGEMFISPEDVLKQQMTRFGERAFLDAVNSIMKEHGLAMAAGRQPHRADTGDPVLDRLVNTLYTLWLNADDKLKGWVEVQFDRAFPADIVAEAQKKQQETSRQVSAG